MSYPLWLLADDAPNKHIEDHTDHRAAILSALKMFKALGCNTVQMTNYRLTTDDGRVGSLRIHSPELPVSMVVEGASIEGDTTGLKSLNDGSWLGLGATAEA